MAHLCVLGTSTYIFLEKGKRSNITNEEVAQWFVSILLGAFQDVPSSTPICATFFSINFYIFARLSIEKKKYNTQCDINKCLSYWSVHVSLF
jgi:hypothetical protein